MRGGSEGCPDPAAADGAASDYWPAKVAPAASPATDCDALAVVVVDADEGRRESQGAPADPTVRLLVGLVELARRRPLEFTLAALLVGGFVLVATSPREPGE